VRTLVVIVAVGSAAARECDAYVNDATTYP